ncbi:uncharacterized protein TrAtP1_003153 [Trichoderma atroviride]|uniref:uncharacterized protein n=1 Tax=Hypocrea atroviridis TaxID=63577 RepID=UPI0033272B39|nr:hypothetical protein TrAtP1_003153 [Trichoderma atroviride]
MPLKRSARRCQSPKTGKNVDGVLSAAQRSDLQLPGPNVLPAPAAPLPLHCLGAPRKPQLVVTTSQLEPASPASPWPILASTTITTAANDNHDRASAIPLSLLISVTPAAIHNIAAHRHSQSSSDNTSSAIPPRALG